MMDHLDAAEAEGKSSNQTFSNQTCDDKPRGCGGSRGERLITNFQTKPGMVDHVDPPEAEGKD
jgi:hypothetical protein